MARITPSEHGQWVGPPVWSPRVEAAFFDLDKTVIAKASMVAFSGPLHRAGLLSRRMLLRAAWGQLVYAQFGASPEKLAKLRDSVLRLTIGWDQAEISEIVRETLVDVVEPIVYEEALELIREHRTAGRKVFIISASPEEIVAPLAQLPGGRRGDRHASRARRPGPLHRKDRALLLRAREGRRDAGGGRA